MTVVINGRFFALPVTGVRRYAEQITGVLGSIRDDLLILVPPDAEVGRAFAGVPVAMAGQIRGPLWEQTDLPLALRRRGNPLLVNLQPIGPLAYKRQIATYHDLTYRRYPQSYSRTFRWWYRVLSPPVLKRSSAVITSSEFTKTQLTAQFGLAPGAVHVVPGAADARFAPADGRKSEVFALAVGSLAVHKNISALVSAWADVHAQTGVPLRVVGEPLPVAGKDYDSGSSDGVTFLGRIDDDELVRLYQQAALFVMPSLHEGFGIPIVEAQACGCAVAASNAASIPEVLAGSGALFNPADTADIARVCTAVLSDEPRRLELVRLGLANAGRFSWSAAAGQVSSLIDAVIDERA